VSSSPRCALSPSREDPRRRTSPRGWRWEEAVYLRSKREREREREKERERRGGREERRKRKRRGGRPLGVENRWRIPSR